MKVRAIATLLLTGACAAPTSEWSWAPAELLKAPPQSEYEGKPAVYLSKRLSYLLVSRWREDSYTRIHEHVVLAILNEKGFEYADVRVPYRAKAKFIRFEARTVNPDGSITEVAPGRIYDDELSKSEEEEGWNFKARVFSFPDVAVGSVLEFQYILEEPSIYSSISSFLNESLPVKRHLLSISGTDDMAYKIKSYNTKAQFETDKSGEYWTISWSLEDVPASSKEGYRLGRTYFDPWFSFVVTRFAKYSYSVEAYSDWDHGVGRVGKELYYENDEYYEGFDPKVDYSGCADKVCRVDKAVSYLADNHHFRGWKGWPGRKAKEATDARRASGFEKNRLLWWILKKEGIDAKFGFVNRYHSEYRDRDHASSDRGNHVILRVEKQDGIAAPIWVDAACEYCKAGELPIWLKDAEALVVHASKPPPSLKVETKAEWAKVTGTPNHAEGSDVRHLVTLDASGTTELETVSQAEGRTCMDLANENLETKADEWKKRAEKAVSARHQGAKLLSHQPMKIEGGRCTRSMKYAAPGYANLDEGRLLVPLTVFRSKWDRALRNDRKRELQIAFWYPERLTETIQLSSPEGFEPLALPKEQVATAKGVTVRVSAKRDGDAVSVTRSIQLHPGLYDAKNYPQIVAALDTFSSARQMVIELGPKGSPPITSSEPGGTPRK